MVNNTSKEAEMPGMHAGAEGGLRVEVDYGQSVRLPRVSGLYQAEAALKPICIAAVTGPMFHNTQAVCHSMPSQHTPSQSLPPFIQPYIHPSVLPLTVCFLICCEIRTAAAFLLSLHASLSCKPLPQVEERPCRLKACLAQSVHDLIGLLFGYTPYDVSKQPSAVTVDPTNSGAYNLQCNSTLSAPQNC